MKKLQRKWDSLMTPWQKEIAIRSIISHFHDEFDQEISMIAAEDHLDFMLDTLGSNLYNKGVEDARIIFQENHQNLEINLGSLLRS